jgi:Cobalamin-independent synthase, Catalytic domain
VLATKLGCVSEISSTEQFPWRPASATGVGSLPGKDPLEAMRVIFGELPELPHLAELPARGPGADIIGRTAAMLVDLPVETTSRGWRCAARPGRDAGRALSLLSSDLDTLEQVAAGYQGPLKVQACGPWTLAAMIELPRSQDPVLADAGAVADLAESLAEGLGAHLAEVRKRVPGATVLLQLDEPALPAVLAGGVPTASGLNRLPVLDSTDAESGLRSVISATRAFTIVHCCAAPVPFGVVAGAGAHAIGFDRAVLRPGEEESLAQAVEAGLGILAGVERPTDPIPQQDAERSRPPALPSPRRTAEGLIDLWRRMGWPASRKKPGSRPPELAAQVVLTPGCGMAGASPRHVREVLRRCREAARLLPELIEEGTL